MSKKEPKKLIIQEEVTGFLLYTAPGSDIKIEAILNHEIHRLECTILPFFGCIENIVELRSIFTIENFANIVNRFLRFNKYQALGNYGKITHKQAKEKTYAEYEKFNKLQKIESDLYKEIKASQKQHKKQIRSGGEDE